MIKGTGKLLYDVTIKKKKFENFMMCPNEGENITILVFPWSLEFFDSFEIFLEAKKEGITGEMK